MKIINGMMEKKVGIALLVIVVIAVICSVMYWGQIMLQQDEPEEDKEMIDELPPDVKNELDILREEKSFAVTGWEIDEKKRKFVIYTVAMSDKQLNQLQEKKVGDWTVTAVEDTDYISEMEAARAELMQLEKDPELQISGFSMSAGLGERKVNMWVYHRTPENEALDEKVVHGWTIHVWTSPTPPPKE